MVKSCWSLACGFAIFCMASQSAHAQNLWEVVVQSRGSHPVATTSAFEEVPAPPALIEPDQNSEPIMHQATPGAAASYAPSSCVPPACVPSAGCAAPEPCHLIDNGCAVPAVSAGCGPAACIPSSCVPTSECAAPEPCRPIDNGCAVPATVDCTQYHANACYGGHAAAPGTCHCTNGCPCGCQSHSCFDCLKKCCCCGSWCHTTGDMYPHFPYRPAYHGNYYFRPYNYTTVYEQRGWAARLGAHPANPYSVAMFQTINEDAPPVNLPVLPIRNMDDRLPNLEDLVGVH